MSDTQFSSLLDHVLQEQESIFKPASKEDLAQRKIDRVAVIAEELKKKGTQNPDGTWDFKGDVDLSDLGLKELPLKFGRVGGSFYCGGNQLTTLEGAPSKVGGDFYCSWNQLTTLEGAPSKVVGDFYCYDNRLTTLEGAPKEVGEGFYCYKNQLTTLEGAPKEVGGGFSCGGNQLTTLEGAPSKVVGDFYCYDNKKKFTEEEVRKVSTVKGSIVT